MNYGTVTPLNILQPLKMIYSSIPLFVDKENSFLSEKSRL